jgi:MFS transporter, OPA family, glycerol-3-phosphate transporter
MTNLQPRRRSPLPFSPDARRGRRRAASAALRALSVLGLLALCAGLSLGAAWAQPAAQPALATTAAPISATTTEPAPATTAAPISATEATAARGASDAAAPAGEAQPAPAPAAKKPGRKPTSFIRQTAPILILVLVIIFVVSRLPKVEVQHSPEFKRRRLLNWLPLGLTYAFLYMARYNTVVLMETGGITQQQFGNIDAIGAVTYGLSFLLNGPLTDRWGGRVTILLAAAGAIVANVAIGLLIYTNNVGDSPVLTIGILYAINMYFQSFGAVSIVKVNSGWFHLRERGVFGGIFGILISLGLYFAFDWGHLIARNAPSEWLFFIPSGILFVFWILCWRWVRDHPSHAGFADFDPGDASSGDNEPRPPAWTIMKRMLTSKIILTIAVIELCSGFLRQGILKWYRTFAGSTGSVDTFVYSNWGMVSCIAGITGGIFAGLISDHFFQSRRGPVSSVLYGIMVAGCLLIFPVLAFPGGVSWIIAFMAMAIIGVHGMLSGVASQDFGGKKNAGTATGIIDGFVYLGTAMQAVTYGYLLPEKGSPAGKDFSNWYAWPGAMLPMAIIGLFFATRIWNARAGKTPPTPNVTQPSPEPGVPTARVVK